MLGSLISIFAGREIGTLPAADDISREMAPAVIVVTAFLTSYSLFDVMAVGLAKGKSKTW